MTAEKPLNFECSVADSITTVILVVKKILYHNE